MEEDNQTNAKRALFIVNCVLLSLGNCGGPLLMRLYFLRGGKRIWLSSWLETAGWPLIIFPLMVTYFQRRKSNSSAKFFTMRVPVFAASAAIGLFMGLDDYLYAYGVARLPVSTSALIIASQLAFTAGFAFLLVKQKFTAFSINAVVLLVVGAVVLGLNTDGDRPEGESKKEYYLGFFMTVAAAALYGFLLPVIEWTYKKAKQVVDYTLVMEIQMVLCLFATIFCTVGMVVNKDFKAIPREARAYELGEARYYIVLVWSAIFWQFFFLGAIGVVFSASSLLSGIIIAVLLPVTEILSVIFYKEKFQSEKGVSLALSLWGFVSYFYGEIKHNKEQKKFITQTMTRETEMPLALPA